MSSGCTRHRKTDTLFRVLRSLPILTRLSIVEVKEKKSIVFIHVFIAKADKTLFPAGLIDLHISLRDWIPEAETV